MSLEDKIKEERLKKIEELRKTGIDPYPAKVKRTHTIGEVRSKYDLPSEELEKCGEQFDLTGRLISKRSFGKATFFHIMDFTGKIQGFIQVPDVGKEKYNLFQKKIDIGDFIGISGSLFRTKTGELTLRVMDFTLLAKSLRPLPEKWHGLRDVEIRYRHRYLDLIMNEWVREIFKKRSTIISKVREFLNFRGFIEVETPVIQPVYGGARARPFITHHNVLDMDLYLRIAPELYLKRLLVGGFEKVYELSKCFRNEGISRVHNPEFTMLEFYIAYASYEDLIPFTEELIIYIADEVNGSREVEWEGHRIYLTPPFEKRRFHELLAEFLNVAEEELWNKEFLCRKCEEYGIEIKGYEGEGALQQELFEKVVERNLIQPTFVIDHPLEISPLAKRKKEDERLVERFELFIGGREIANAFTELNDPVDQRERFLKQAEERKKGDAEAHPFDEDFLLALEYGMPPSAGEGIGIDRLVMLMCGVDSVREVLLFPLLRKDEEKR